MATSVEFNKRMTATIRKMLLDEYPHMRTSTLNSICRDSARDVARNYELRSKQECKGVRPLKFFDLPREIRDLIYEHAVKPSDGLPITLNRCEKPECILNKGIGKTFHAFRSDGSLAHGIQPAIARTCRKLRVEALPLFYQINEFAACLNSETRVPVVHRAGGRYRPSRKGRKLTGVQTLSDWILSIGSENVSSIRGITVHYMKEADKKALSDLDLLPAKNITFVYIDRDKLLQSPPDISGDYVSDDFDSDSGSEWDWDAGMDMDMEIDIDIDTDMNPESDDLESDSDIGMDQDTDEDSE